MATEARRATLEILLSAKNVSTSAFAQVQSSLAKINAVGRDAFASVARVAGSARVQLLGVVAALGGVQKLLIEPAQFEESLVRISIASKTLENDVDRVRSAIEELAVGTGTKREDLAAGFEVAAKRAKDFEEALHLVTTANKLATVTNTPVRDSVVELTAALEAYGLELTEVELVAAKLFATSQRLPETAGDLIGELGKIGPQARAAGIGLEQVLAAVVASESEGKKASRTLRNFDSILEIVAENGAAFRRELATISATGLNDFESAFQRVDNTVTSLLDGLRELGKVAASAFAAAQFPDLAAFLADAAGNLDRVRISARIAGLEFARWRSALPIAEFRALVEAFRAGFATIELIGRALLELPRVIVDVARVATIAATDVAISIGKALDDIPGVDLSAAIAGNEAKRKQLIESVAKTERELGPVFAKLIDDMVTGAQRTDEAFIVLDAAMNNSRLQSELYRREIVALETEMESLGKTAKEASGLIVGFTDEEFSRLRAQGTIERPATARAPQRLFQPDNPEAHALARSQLLSMQEQFSFATQPDETSKELFEQHKALAEKHAQDLAQIAESARSSMASSFGSAFDGFIQGTLDAKEAVRSLASSFLSMFNQMIAHRAFSAVFGGGPGSGPGGGAFFGGLVNAIFSAKGNVLPGSFMPVKAFAGGGIVTRPTIGIIREAGMNEAVVPLPDGKRIPVALSGRGQGTVINQYWNVNAMDGPSVMHTLTSAAGRRAIEAVSMNAARTRRRAR